MKTKRFAKIFPIVSAIIALVSGFFFNPAILFGFIFIPGSGIFLPALLLAAPWLMLVISTGITTKQKRLLAILEKSFYALWALAGPFICWFIILPGIYDHTKNIYLLPSSLSLDGALVLFGIVAGWRIVSEVRVVRSLPGDQRGKRLVSFVTKSVVVLSVGAFGYYFYTTVIQNPAVDAIRPVEDALVRNGAVKVCGSADPGRGPDAVIPDYDATFQLIMSKDAATELIKKVTRDNGFMLAYTDSPAKNVDRYLAKNKQSNYPGLAPGTIGLGVSITGNSYDKPLSCTIDGITYTPEIVDATHSVVNIGVELPGRE